jgi:gag-polypeptide of LTR copia-type
MDSDDIARRRHAPILSKDNREAWFRIMRLYLGAESIDFAIQQTEAEYAYSEGCWNDKRRAKYKAASCKVLYELVLCVDSVDQELFEEFSTAKDIWEALWAKYSRISPQKSRESLKRLYEYKLGPDTLIEDAWTELRQIRRRIAVAYPAISKATTDDSLFEYLLGGLPDEYSTTCEALEAQPSLQVNEKLLVLQNYQDQLRATTTSAFVAKSKTNRRRKAKKICFLCGQGHWVRQCQVWKDLAKITYTCITSVAQLQEPRSRSRQSRRPRSRSRSPHKTKDATHCVDWITDSESTSDTDNSSIAPTPTHSVRTKGGKLYSGREKSRYQEETTSDSVTGALQPIALGRSRWKRSGGVRAGAT